MQNIITNNLFGSINLAMAIIYILYKQYYGAFLGDKPIFLKCMTMIN